jgi:hypothetical protein
MAKENASGKKVPVWLWVVGGVLVLGVIGIISGGDDDTPQVAAPDPVPAEVSPAPEEAGPEATTSDFAIATVEERYEAECFANLGESFEYRYEISPEAMREGFVYVSVGGDVLQFAVGMNNNTGSFLTVPHNEFTVEKLEQAGC